MSDFLAFVDAIMNTTKRETKLKGRLSNKAVVMLVKAPVPYFCNL